MPKRTDIKKILIIGSGPIIIGQACEFDYSGTQACKALRSLGYEIVLVNSNPATIMTDPETADVTYIEPLNVARLTAIIKKERPDALLPNLGGQSGLNLCTELARAGVLDEYKVQVIGVQVDAIDRGEDRIAFKEAMNALGIEMARSAPAYSVEEALGIAKDLGYPCVLRPAYTMGGAGGGIVHNEEELRMVCARGIQTSMVGQVLVEESIIGWEELELEVVRDATGHMITICFIENIDPIGVHTGDSFCSAPMLTISPELQARMQESAYAIVQSIGVIGGTNVQFAHDPATGRICVIEINPRTSRSSALASKATGFPIALVSAMLATGITLAEIPCGKYGNLANYKPDGEYVVIKFARWAFEKFKGARDALGTQMKAVGEVMSIGKTYKEAFHKAIRSLETGRYGLGGAKNFGELDLPALLELLKFPTSERQFVLYEALKKGATVEQLCAMTYIKPWFLEQMLELVNLEKAVVARGRALDADLLREAKLSGFSDRYLATLTGLSEGDIRAARKAAGLKPGFEKVHVSGTADAGYYYSSYHIADETPVSPNKKILILGGGPNRIGQGIEFDYCCVHAAFALRKLGLESILINCNPETVSTDYDTSDKLYFEPLTLEDVLEIYEKEQPLGVITQFGGQTPLNLAASLKECGVNILGTSPETIDAAEDRDIFNEIMKKLDIPMPPSGMATTVDEARGVVARIGYPVVLRPSYVLGGRGMEIVHDDENLERYMRQAVGVTPERPILIDHFLANALECEADAISDGHDVFVPAVMEHIEYAGIHSGDSACVLPSRSISAEHLQTIERYTKTIAREMGVVGLMNMQYAISQDGVVYVLEANPRASRTVPLVSKVCSIQMVQQATTIITAPYTGLASPVPGLERRPVTHYGVKEAVFPFNMFPEVDPLLGPEMRSTGEVLGLSSDYGAAFYKAQEATQTALPTQGTVLFSVNSCDRDELPDIVRAFAKLGFTILATSGTRKFLENHSIIAIEVPKVGRGNPDILEVINSGKVDIVINTPLGTKAMVDDSFIRKAAIRNKLCYITTLSAGRAAVEGIASARNGIADEVKPLQDYTR